MKDWFGSSWHEFFLPERLRAVDDHIFSDPNGLSLIKESEAVIEKIITRVLENGPVKGTQVYKKNGRTFKLRLKVSQKRLSLMCFDTHLSPSAIKKRIVITIARQHSYKPNGKLMKEGLVYYMKNGKSHVRSIQKSPFFHGITEKLLQLDSALDGHAPTMVTGGTSATLETDSPSKNQQSEQARYEQAIRSLSHHGFDLPQALANRLDTLLDELSSLIPSLHLLSIEDRHQIKRMVNEDIPFLLEAYQDLDEDSQSAQMSRLYEALTKMEITLQHLQEHDHQAKHDRFEYLLKLNEKRYSNREDPPQ
ncbi:hypothetical protein HNR44_001041 [Geomicrobium halophilum]|uniref:Uncharacterized protein n=1 Tax=Geomicrobium halophilum TaxID=549000 RepID=A0A841PXZ2_9BACL|nr:hypothetical protein [Geomicrobium halophilum]MBB6449092.1 hypothetical protein [Geomicrobium halophilum]